MLSKDTPFHQVDCHGLSHIQAITTTRNRGVSLPPFDCFNVGDHVGDDPFLVAKNRSQLLHSLNIKHIQWLNQIHGAQVVEVNHYQAEPPDADAAFTRQPNIGLAIMTADCLPILLVDDNGTQVAAIHGGWRPLAAGIIGQTIKKFSTNSIIKAWLGPCIGPSAFEVGSEVRQQFLQLNAALKQAFVAGKNKKYLADLHFIAKTLLQQEGVEAIAQLNHCTFSLPEQYFSYRRSGQTGRMASVIVIKN